MKKSLALLSLLVIAATLNAQDKNEDQLFERLKKRFEQDNRQNEPRRALFKKYGDAFVVVKYHIKTKRASFQGISMEDFGRTRITEVEEYVMGTMVSPDGVMVINGDIFMDVQAGSGAALSSFGSNKVSQPYDFETYFVNTKKSYKAKSLGVDPTTNLALLQIENNDGAVFSYIDIEKSAMTEAELNATQCYDPFLTPQIRDITQSLTQSAISQFTTSDQKPKDFKDFRVIAQASTFFEFTTTANRQYAQFLEPFPGGIPLFDYFNQKFIGFSIRSRESKITRQKANEGITDQASSIMSFNMDNFDEFGQFTDKVALTKNILDLIKNRSNLITKSSWTGIIEFDAVNQETASFLGIKSGDNTYGILVNEVVQGSPAHKAGLRSGDVLNKWDNESIKATTNEEVIEFKNKLSAIPAGTEVDIQYKRFGSGKTSTKSSKITLETAPKSAKEAQTYHNESFGTVFAEVTQDIVSSSAYLNENHIGNVTVRDTESGGWFEMGGLRDMDIVLKINNKQTSSLADVKDALEQIEKEKPKDILFLIERAAETQFIKISPNWSKLR
ncbi:MAG: PDZ domain-containing protein [Planctomycetes bacterium]|nr:PDZ domain-containing protein [Planctomycetota bacterium]